MSEPGPDSFTAGLATVATSRKGSGLLQLALPWIGAAVLSAFTGVLGWVGGQLDTKVELQEAIALHKEGEAYRALVAQQHAQEMAAIASLRHDVLSEDLRAPGKVTRLERGEYFAFRALAEVRAMALTAESHKAREAKESQGNKFARSFDARVGGREPAAVYDELFAKVAVP